MHLPLWLLRCLRRSARADTEYITQSLTLPVHVLYWWCGSRLSTHHRLHFLQTHHLSSGITLLSSRLLFGWPSPHRLSPYRRICLKFGNVFWLFVGFITSPLRSTALYILIELWPILRCPLLKQITSHTLGLPGEVKILPDALSCHWLVTSKCIKIESIARLVQVLRKVVVRLFEVQDLAIIVLISSKSAERVVLFEHATPGRVVSPIPGESRVEAEEGHDRLCVEPQNDNRIYLFGRVIQGRSTLCRHPAMEIKKGIRSVTTEYPLPQVERPPLLDTNLMYT